MVLCLLLPNERIKWDYEMKKFAIRKHTSDMIRHTSALQKIDIQNTENNIQQDDLKVGSSKQNIIMLN